MYTVDTNGDAQQQIDALPAEALAPFAELRVVLETAPWSGRPFRRTNPEGALRMHTFGPSGQGLVTYVVLESLRRVDVLQVVWYG